MLALYKDDVRMISVPALITPPKACPLPVYYFVQVHNEKVVFFDVFDGADRVKNIYYYPAWGSKEATVVAIWACAVWL